MHSGRIFVCGFALCAIFGISTQAATNAAHRDRIAFLNLTLVRGTMRLESMNVVEGTFKKPRRLTLAGNHILYRVLNSAGVALFEGAVVDPTRVELEYVDSFGQLQSKLVVSDSVDFIVRFPFYSDASAIEFSGVLASSIPGGRGRQTESLGVLGLPSRPSVRAGAQTFPVTEIVVNGPADKRINIVFLSEGYTIPELANFHEDVLRVIDSMSSVTPYAEYFSYFNVYTIDVPSNESGTDHPGTAYDCPGGLPVFYKDTYFNSTFDKANIHRLLVPSTSVVNSVLLDNIPFWDIAFVIVNHSWYGGSGGQFATFSLDSWASELAFHEVGHSFADLADEYEYGGINGFEAPNATEATTRDSIKWNAWIDVTTPIPTPEDGAWADVIGLFEGAVYVPFGWYRPKLNCKMRELGIPYCEVCSEQTVRSVYNILSPIESSEPIDRTLTLCEDATIGLSARRMVPISPSTVSSWFVDGEWVAPTGDSLWFDASTFALGQHEISVVISDTTPLVRTDPFQLLTASATWHIQIGLTTGDINSDLVITVSDIIYLVNYVFKAGPEPIPCVAVGDINCSGQIASADVISLVNFVFRGGPQPCDACSLVPEVWTCP